MDQNLIGGRLRIKTEAENQINQVMAWAKNGSDAKTKLELEEQFTRLEERKKHHNAAIRELVERGEISEEGASYHLLEKGKF